MHNLDGKSVDYPFCDQCWLKLPPQHRAWLTVVCAYSGLGGVGIADLLDMARGGSGGPPEFPWSSN